MNNPELTLAPAVLTAGIPSLPQAWYLVCRSDELPRGAVRSLDLGNRSIVVYRGEDSGKIVALDAHCQHMGTHLGRGAVIGDTLRCPLHYWRYGTDGRCEHIPGIAAIPDRVRQNTWPVIEKFGVVFVFNGPEPLFPAPSYDTSPDDGLLMQPGPSIELDCPWYAVASNGYDVLHFKTVHERDFRKAPILIRQSPYRVCLKYISKVIGKSIADHTMKWISRDHIDITITCHGGTVITVESDLGRTRSALMLCLQPLENQRVRVTPVFGVYRSSFGLLDRMRVGAARWLFSAFLRRDVEIMDKMKFNPDFPQSVDPVLYEFLEFLRQLPAGDTGD